MGDQRIARMLSYVGANGAIGFGDFAIDQEAQRMQMRRLLAWQAVGQGTRFGHGCPGCGHFPHDLVRAGDATMRQREVRISLDDRGKTFFDAGSRSEKAVHRLDIQVPCCS